jgi:very-short-patch-repair endonuclease
MNPESFRLDGFKPYNRSHRDYARENRSKPTLTEKLMRNILKKDQLWVRFLRQKPIWPYRADFYCATARLVIEVDGISHEWNESYDQQRDSYLENLWVTTLRFTSEQVLMDRNTVQQTIENFLQEKNSP